MMKKTIKLIRREGDEEGRGEDDIRATYVFLILFNSFLIYTKKKNRNSAKDKRGEEKLLSLAMT